MGKKENIDSPPKISVIIPVYNTEFYLRECIDSVINQSLKEIEVICVNDGSTDNSLAVLKEYEKKDERITVLTQDNQGVSIARNNALKIAKGKYIHFLDSDDYLDLDACRKLYQKSEQLSLDMLSFKGQNFHTETRELLPSPYYSFTYLPENWSKEIFNYKDCIDFVHRMAVTTHLTFYRRDFIVKHNITFPEHLCFEDNFFFTKAILNAKRCSILQEVLLYRRIHSASITQNWNIHLGDYFDIANLVIDYVKNFDAHLYEQYKLHYIGSCLVWYKKYGYEYQKKWAEGLIKLMTKYGKTDDSDFKLVNELHYIPKISIIVPVYNTENYLRTCLDSILEQSLSEIEVICINDGSTDNSLAILKEYAKKDDRILVIEQQNKGLGAARNAGLDKAHGEYIMFVDSDDFIARDTAQLMYNEIKSQKTDVAICDIECINKLSSTADEKNKKWAEAMPVWTEKYVKESGKYPVPANIKKEFASIACNKLYKFDIIKSRNIRFPEGLIGEDEYWLWAYMIHCKEYVYVNKKLYSYIQRDNSIMTSTSFQYKCLDYLEINRQIYTYVQKYSNIIKYKMYLTEAYIRKAEEILKKISADCYNDFLLQLKEYALNYNASDAMFDFYKKKEKTLLRKK